VPGRLSRIFCEIDMIPPGDIVLPVRSTASPRHQPAARGAGRDHLDLLIGQRKSGTVLSVIGKGTRLRHIAPAGLHRGECPPGRPACGLSDDTGGDQLA
jgi:hypothetical protein